MFVHSHVNNSVGKYADLSLLLNQGLPPLGGLSRLSKTTGGLLNKFSFYQRAYRVIILDLVSEF